MRKDLVAGPGLITLGVGAAAGALLGPLGTHTINWRISTNMENQLLGQDAVTLLLFAPSVAAAGVLWIKKHPFAPVLALGPTMYGLYTFTSMILFPEYDRYAGNNEMAVPLWIGLTTLSWTLGATAWSRIETGKLPGVPTAIRRGVATALLLLGGFFAAAWTLQIRSVLGGGPTLSEYEEHPTGFWLVKTYDLAFVVPIVFAVAIGLLRNNPLAVKAALGVAAFQTLMSASISAMGIVMLVRDDPSATIALPAVTAPVTLIMAALTFKMFQTFVTDIEHQGSTPRVSSKMDETSGVAVGLDSR